MDNIINIIINYPILNPIEVEKKLNNTAPMQISDIIGMFHKSTLKYGKKKQFRPLLCQIGHEGLDSTRETRFTSIF